MYACLPTRGDFQIFKKGSIFNLPIQLLSSHQITHASDRMLSLPSLLSLSALSQPPQLRPSSPLHSRAAALRVGLLGAASATLGRAPAFARWDAKKDYMVGAEKNAIDDYEYVQVVHATLARTHRAIVPMFLHVI